MASSLGIWESAWGYIGVIIFLAVLSSLFVALRFWSRRISRLGVYWDDWLALLTLLIHHGLGATILIAFISDGLGFPMMRLKAADPRAAAELQKLVFIGTILYGAGSTSVRLSVVIFYFRIFPTTTIRRGGYVLVGICAAWFIAIEALMLATCTPIAFMWDPAIAGGHCVKTPAGAIVLGALNVIIDAFTVALPVHEVFKLNLSRKKKLIISGVFLIGGLATAASLTRLVSTSLYFKSGAGEGPGAIAALLSATAVFEIYIAIIGACAPTLVPVYKKLRRQPVTSDKPVQHRSSYTTRPSYTTRQPKPRMQLHGYVGGGTNPALSRTALRESDEEDRPFKRLDDVHVLVPAKERGELWTDISARPASEGVPLGGIRVQRDVTWDSEE
ncbi:hypothetical protein F5Y14DRAFT_53802 [Nemania sp. NC0429]|nr:hypothetical protein F5Y14DRAFT_53802 [Nemania sp. NC0429]